MKDILIHRAPFPATEAKAMLALMEFSGCTVAEVEALMEGANDKVQRVCSLAAIQNAGELITKLRDCGMDVEVIELPDVSTLAGMSNERIALVERIAVVDAVASAVSLALRLQMFDYARKLIEFLDPAESEK